MQITSGDAWRDHALSPIHGNDQIAIATAAVDNAQMKTERPRPPTVLARMILHAVWGSVLNQASVPFSCSPLQVMPVIQSPTKMESPSTQAIKNRRRHGAPKCGLVCEDDRHIADKRWRMRPPKTKVRTS